MKNVLASLLLLTGSMSMAATGQLFVDGRVDHKSYSPNDAVKKPGYETWQLSRFKIDYQGKVSDENTYRIRLDALGNTAQAPTARGTQNWVDLAYISHKFTDMVSLTAGKFTSGMGGIEGFVNSPGDIYLRSMAGDEVALVYQPVGAQANLTFGDHKVMLNFANNTQDVNATVGGVTNYNQTRNLMGAAYLGKFNEGNIVATASYHFEDFVQTTGTKLKNSFAAIGGKFVIDNLEIEADYLANKYDYDPQGTQVLSTNSALALVRYKFVDLGSVHVKYENTERKTGTSATADTKNTYSGVTAAFEYKPVKDENWRMHVAYTQRDNKPETGDTQTEKIVYAGMRVYADFLK